MNRFEQFETELIAYLKGYAILFTLSFADNLVVSAQDFNDFNFMTRTLFREYKNQGIEININKEVSKGNKNIL